MYFDIRLVAWCMPSNSWGHYMCKYRQARVLNNWLTRMCSCWKVHTTSAQRYARGSTLVKLVNALFAYDSLKFVVQFYVSWQHTQWGVPDASLHKMVTNGNDLHAARQIGSTEADIHALATSLPIEICPIASVESSWELATYPVGLENLLSEVPFFSFSTERHVIKWWPRALLSQPKSGACDARCCPWIPNPGFANSLAIPARFHWCKSTCIQSDPISALCPWLTTSDTLAAGFGALWSPWLVELFLWVVRGLVTDILYR